jgi:hypothetical protein
MKPSLSFWPAVAVFALGGLAPRWAHAQDAAAAPLPTLPAPDDDAASAPPVRATTKTDTPIVSAGTVHTNHVDTVVVAEPGSNVTVHGSGDGGSSDGHREYAPDPGRKAAIIASPIVFGVGGAVAGITYLTARAQTNCTTSGVGYGTTYSSTTTCTHGDTVPPLVLYDVIVGAVPSTPRWVVGDVGGALLYTGLRGGSLLVASVVDWGNGQNNWIGPFTLGFLLPITLGIVDLATSPHREDLQPTPKPQQDARLLHPRITALSPVALTDAEHRVNGAVLDLSATF